MVDGCDSVAELRRSQHDTLNWAAAMLGKVSRVQDTHTHGLGKIASDLDEVKTMVVGLGASIDRLPSVVADAVRDAVGQRACCAQL
jgi:hypothetical protein